jgi:Prealbumin-like fold domain
VTLDAGSYSVSESGPSGYGASYSADCAGSIAVGQTKTCTVTNDDIAPKLIVIKHVINDNGGTSVAGDFTMSVDDPGTNPPSFPGAESPGTSVTVDPGSYSVSESGPSGYEASYSSDCTGSVAIGETKTCTVTNDDIAPQLIVIKHVINDNGGTATASSFTMSVDDPGTNPPSFPGAESPGTTVTVDPGSYSVGESGPSGYAASFSTDCTGSIAIGQTKTCTVTNNDIQPKLIVIKHVINDNGRHNVAGDFTMNVTGSSPSPSSFPGAESPGTNVGINVGSYSVAESGPAGYTSTFSTDCSGSIAVGQTKTCTVTNNDMPMSMFTDTLLCTFDVNSSQSGNQFRLLFTPDPASAGYKLNATNPGQYYYNVFDATSGPATLTMTLPYPWVTQGAVPIHVYNGVTFTTVNGQTCLTPGPELANSTYQVTLGSYTPQAFGSTTTVTVTIPAGVSSGLAYVNIHLDYGLKGTTNWSKGSNNEAISSIGKPTIFDNVNYHFSDTTGGSGDAVNNNTFKKDPGIGGLVQKTGTLMPVANAQVQIYDNKGVLLATVYTDADGWYMWQYKYTGKAATFVVKLPAYGLQQSATLKSNGFLVVSFLVP